MQQECARREEQKDRNRTMPAGRVEWCGVVYVKKDREREKN